MLRDPKAELSAAHSRRVWLTGLFVGALAFLAACSGTSDLFNTSQQPAQPQQPSSAIGSGQVRVGLILPLTGAGNPGAVARSMKNAAEMALAEFSSPNIQQLGN